MLFPRHPTFTTDTDDEGEIELDIRRYMVLEDTYAEVRDLFGCWVLVPNVHQCAR